MRLVIVFMFRNHNHQDQAGGEVSGRRAANMGPTEIVLSCIWMHTNENNENRIEQKRKAASLARS